MNKMYYSIREAAEMTGLQPHVLRYWETEFKDLKPKKNRAGNRIYREQDIDLIMEIKNLLHDQRFTIEGARQELKNRRSGGKASKAGKRERVIEEVKSGLKEILEMLKD
jgi:DNA-binding transcriptional MerR regulator